MRERQPDLFYILAIGILLFLVWRGCNKKPDTHEIPVPVHIEMWDTLLVPGDTIKVTKYINRPQPIYVHVVGVDTIRFYSDTTLIDSATYLVANDSVRGVKLHSFIEFFQKKYDKVITHTIIDSIPYPVPYRQWILSGGCEVGYGAKGANISPLLSLKLRSNKSIQYRYGIIDKSHNVGFQFPLIVAKK
jgi:hypothetical protein